ncbi:amidohydrolase [Alteribacillus sp. HJP-4]
MPDKDSTSGFIEKISGKGKLLMSGMYNTHGHTPMALIRGCADDLPLQDWLEHEIWPREAVFTKQSVRAGTSLALIEMIKNGTIAFLDMYHLYMNDVYELVMDSGLKAVLARGMIGFGTEEEQRGKLKEAVTFAKDWEAESNGHIKGMLFPHAPYTCKPPFLEKIIESSRSYRLPLGIHLAETLKEVNDHKRDYGRSPVDHLHELGFFEQTALLTHVVHISESEMDMLSGKPVSVSHNPMSNAKLGSGIAPVSRMLKKNIPVSLGTDSTVSNNTLDIFEEMRFAVLLQKAADQNPAALSAHSALQMATKNGAEALGFKDSGIVREGAAADFIMLDISSAHLQPLQNLFSHLIYTASGHDVTDVFVNGRQLLKNRALQTLDEEKIVFEANRHSRAIDTLFRENKKGD